MSNREKEAEGTRADEQFAGRVGEALQEASVVRFFLKLFPLLRRFFWFRLGSVLSVVFLPLLTKVIIDRNVPGELDSLTFILIGVGFVLLLVHVGFGILCIKELSLQIPHIIRLLRHQIFNKLQFMHFGFLDKIQTGKLLAKYSFDTQKIEMTLIPVIHEILPSALQAVLLLGGIAIFDWRLSLFTLIVAPVIVFLRVFFFKSIKERNHHTRVAEANMTGQVNEYISALRLIRGFGQENEVVNLMESSSSLYAHSRKSQITINQTMNMTVFTASQGINLLCIALCAWFVVGHSLSYGTFIAFVGSLPTILWPIHLVSMFSQQYLLGRESYISIKELLDSTYVESWKGNKQINISGQINLRNVSFRYPESEQWSLREINLEIPPNQHVALVGQSGSGKTSLVNLILGLYESTEGTILVDGIPQEELDMRHFRRQCAVVMQENILISGTIAENIAFGVESPSEEELEKAARLAQAHEFITNLPQGYQTTVGERGLTLSGGQCQRIAIARALLRNPRILIFDEATSALDYESEAKIKLAMREIAKDRTVVTIAHRTSTIREANLIVMLQEGKIVQTGTYASLSSNREGAFAKLIATHE